MAKVDRLLLWMGLLSSLKGAFAQNMVCNKIEKVYPIKLVRARIGDAIYKIDEQNIKIFLDYLEILEQEEK